MNETEIIEALKNVVIEGDKVKAKELVQIVLKEKFDPLKAIKQGLVKGIMIVGDGFNEGKYFLPELVMGANTLTEATAILNKEIEREGLEKPTIGKVVLGTVKDDVHNIGKDLVKTLLAANGFEVIDLGVNVPAEKFVEAAEQNQVKIVGISALLTTTIINLPEVIEELKQARLPVKTMVGGAPVTKEFAEEIGADGYGYDAQKAVELARELIKR